MTCSPVSISDNLGRIAESRIRGAEALLREAEEWLVHWEGFFKGSSSSELSVFRERLGAILSRCRLTAGSTGRILAELAELRGVV